MIGRFVDARSARAHLFSNHGFNQWFALLHLCCRGCRRRWRRAVGIQSCGDMALNVRGGCEAQARVANRYRQCTTHPTFSEAFGTAHPRSVSQIDTIPAHQGMCQPGDVA